MFNQLLADLPGLLGPLAGVSVGGHTLVEWAGLVADNVTDSLDLMTSQCAEGDQYLQFCDDIFTTGTPNDLVFEGTFTFALSSVLTMLPVLCIAGAKSGVISALYHYLTSDDEHMVPDILAWAFVDTCLLFVNDFGCVPQDTSSCSSNQLIWNLMDLSLVDLLPPELHDLLIQVFPGGLNLQTIAYTIATDDRPEYGPAVWEQTFRTVFHLVLTSIVG